MIIYDISAIEPYNSRAKGLQSRKQGTLQLCIAEDKYICVLEKVRSDLLPYHRTQYILKIVVS